MLGSTILDVGIGVVLVFLLLSFIATAVREAIESGMKSRAIYLERGIRELLADPSGTGMAKSFYEHPVISSLYRGSFSAYQGKIGLRGRGLPTYIPAKNFAEAIIDLAIRGPVQHEYAASQVAADSSVSALRANITRLKNPNVIRAVLTAADHSEGDLSKVRDNLQAWYDGSMDRVSGWYKRATQFWLFGIGLALAVIFNINTFRIADGLWRDKALREAIATRAEALARDTVFQRKLLDTAYRTQDLKQETAALGAVNLPIGWSLAARTELRARSTAGAGSFISFWLSALLGYIFTALAVTLGAPFWFDVLNKFMVIRSTVKPHEKSPEEASEDRQKPSKPESPPASPPVAQAGAPVQTPPALQPVPPAPIPATPGVPAFMPHQWIPSVSNDPNAGAL